MCHSHDQSQGHFRPITIIFIFSGETNSPATFSLIFLLRPITLIYLLIHPSLSPLSLLCFLSLQIYVHTRLLLAELSRFIYGDSKFSHISPAFSPLPKSTYPLPIPIPSPQFSFKPVDPEHSLCKSKTLC